MEDKIISKSVWSYISKAARTTKTRSLVSVAYFGDGGAKRLPLKPKSVLLVDASDKTVKKGLTSPHELLKLYNKGVIIYSHRDLHAKAYVIGSQLFIGSANASDNAANSLIECMLHTRNRIVVNQAKSFILENCKVPLGEAKIKRLINIYKTEQQNSKIKQADPKKTNANERHFQYFFEYFAPSQKSKNDEKKGYEIAKKRIRNPNTHIVDSYHDYSLKPLKIGDYLISITEVGGKEYISPPGEVVYVKKCNNGKKTTYITYIETASRNRKSIAEIKKLIKLANRGFLRKRGLISKEYFNDIAAIWF